MFSTLPSPMTGARVTFGERALAVLTVCGLIAVPFVVITGVHDYFRTIKEVVFRAEAILGLFFLGVAVTGDGATRLRALLRDRCVAAVAVGALAYGLLTALLSTNRSVSAPSVITIICSFVLFVSVWYASRSVGHAALLLLAPVAAINAVVAVLQEYRLWNPFIFTVDDHSTTTGFIGNPNDLGGYLAICTIVLLGMAPPLRGWQRWVAIGGAAMAIAGIFASQTRTAVLAVAASQILVAWRKPKITIAVLVFFIGGFVAARFVEIPVFSRVVKAAEYVQRGDWSAATSGRIFPFLVAAEMFRDRPLLGWGAGTYKFHFMHGYINAAEAHPEYLLKGQAEMFGETHNDHLQLLAEGGLPAYALFLGSLLILARRPASASERAAATLGPTLAIGVFVLALAFFPLQIAATRHLMLTIAALAVGWSSK